MRSRDWDVGIRLHGLLFRIVVQVRAQGSRHMPAVPRGRSMLNPWRHGD